MFVASLFQAIDGSLHGHRQN